MSMINSLTGLRFTADEVLTQLQEEQAALATANTAQLVGRVAGLHRTRGRYEALLSWEKDVVELAKFDYEPAKVLNIKYQLLLDLSLRGLNWAGDGEDYVRGIRDVVSDIKYRLDEESHALYFPQNQEG